MIPTLSKRLVALALIVCVFGSANGLRCWECGGYDNVQYQCSPDNVGKSTECLGENPVCVLIQDKYTKSSTLPGNVYYTKKCGGGSDLVVKAGGCDSPEQITADAKQTRCYCNNDNCNKVSIAGIGEEKTSPVGGQGGNGAAFHSIHYGLMVLIFSVTFMSIS